MKPEQKCLVVLTPGFPANEEDNACLPWLQSFIRKLNEIFPELKIAVISLEYPFLKKHYTWYGNTVISFDGWKKNKWYKLRMWSHIWRELNMLDKQYKIEGLISFWCGEAAFLGHYFGKAKGIKHLIRVCGQDAKKPNRWLPLIKPRPGELIPISDFLSAEFYKNHQIKPLLTIPIAIDPVSFPVEMPSERDIDILGVGALIPLKRYDQFVEIIYALKKHFPDIKAVQCGVGPEESRIRSMISEFHLQNNFSLAGKQTHADMLRLMQRTKIFLHTSEYEGFGIVCLEALYAGAQVISFCEPMNEQIDHWHIVHNKKEMEQKALDLLRDPHTRFISKLPYSMDDSVKAIMQLFGYKELAIS